MTLLEECLEALSEKLVILSKEETELMYLDMVKEFPMTNWGRINWVSVVDKRNAVGIDDCISILSELEVLDSDIYVLWDEITLPSLLVPMKNVVSNIYDVLAVSSNTWLYVNDKKIVVEFYHENEICIGLKK